MKTKSNYLSNITTGVLVVFVAALFFFPSFKGVVMQGIMKTGLFQPSIPDASELPITTDFAANEEEGATLFENKEGEVVQLSNLRGKVVFINFWATWCPPCIAEMPTIQKLYTEFKDNNAVEFVMVDVDNNRNKSQNFMDKREFDLPVYTPASPIPASYFGGSLPTTIVLNKNGEVILKHEGMGDFSNKEFKTFIEQLIKE